MSRVATPGRLVSAPPSPIPSPEAIELVRPVSFTEANLRVLKASVHCKDLSDDEFAFFVEMCRVRQLNPFARQIFAIVRTGQKGGRTVTYQTSIDGFRAIAERTGKYEGQIGPYWCGEDGKWLDAWLLSTPPAAAKVGILRAGFKEPVKGFARFAGYYQAGGLGLWDRMPDNQLAKCAEAQGLRRAFPESLGGLYTMDEMGQAEGREALAPSERTDVHPDTRTSSTPSTSGTAGPSVAKAVDGRMDVHPDIRPQAAIEAAAIEQFAPLFAAAKAHAELEAHARAFVKACGGTEKTSDKTKRWFSEAYKQAIAALGPLKAGGAR